MTNRQPWHAMTQDLVAVAMGRKHADMVICNGRWVNVHSGEILPGTDVAVIGGRIAYVGPNAGHCIGPNTKLIEAKQRYLVPGLCDAHMHVESGMVTVTEFARAVIPHGTTSMFIDPHEIANVLGLPGVRLMHDEAATLPINVYVQMPSCVPSAPGLETPGAAIGPDEVAEAMTWPGIIGLGEMMNFPGVYRGDDKMHAEMAATMRAGKVIGGHYAAPDLGRAFHGYVAGGPADDHEGTRLEDAVARVRQGMKAMLRLGSAWYDVAAQVKAITELGLDSRNFILCTDDCHSGTLVGEGHMDRVVRHAIACGLRPITAIQMATLNTALHFGVEKDIGSITPGRYADVVITSDLSALPVEMVIAHGEVLAERGRIAVEIPAYGYPDLALGTVRLGKRLGAGDFDVPVPTVEEEGRGAGGQGSRGEEEPSSRKLSPPPNSCRVRVIGVVENQAPTKALERELPVIDGVIQPDAAQDVGRIALVERHRATGGVTNGFVSGFGFNAPCAVASTVAHDSHHMIVVGTDAADMARAANRLGEVGGGVVVYKDGQEIALVELPIAGLMSAERAEVVAAKAERMVEAFVACGCTLHNAFMQLSLLALVVIPELRISDKGIVDVRAFEVVPLVVS
ncbi:Adenine deaminase 3 [Candidatus Promineifilum breve]|uniref:Adenine deaminase n=1 Tax=Candidatus Promineifilum breve TaxID=1806508 RepID=A0A160SZH2_9CHLR|nr:adenine deaminase [Candidatus Promineifilum breve]CUS02981.2 Adenine deaminase 3 [Candidatus Promineifilum breve]